MAKNAEHRLDWDDLRYFLAIARQGTLSRAARSLAVTQPTMSRRLAAFQQQIGTRLFRQTRSGYVLTPAGQEVLAHVEHMEESALFVERAAIGRDAGMNGSVRVTTTKWFANAIVTPLLSPLVVQHRGLEIDIAASANWISVGGGEVDIALRFTRFEQSGIVQRRVAKVGFGLYAAAAYLAAHGQPDFERACAGHFLVAMNDEVTTASDTGYLKLVAARARTAFRSNSRESQASAAAAGVGIVCMPHHLAARTPGLVRLEPRQPAPDRTVWLGMHRELRKIPRVRLVAETLAGGLAQLRSSLDPFG